ncbi:MAG: pilus assembly protein PilM [Candidatus Omnitrophica bacterium]|nr:pilus assembly protein PilM [Candidatus Omnitrophota bacterium]
MTLRTVIMIAEAQISVLQAAGDVFVFSATKDISGLTAEAADLELTEIIRRKGFVKTGTEVWVVFPRKNVVMRQMILPSLDTEELRQMVELQCVSQVPYAREDVAMDYMAVGGTGDGYSSVVLVAVLREQYQRVIRVCVAAGMPLKHMTLSSWGLAQWCLRFSIVAQEASVCVVDLAATECELCFCGHGKVFTSRQLDWGYTQLTGGSVQGFVRQLDMTLSNYAKQKTGPLPSAIVFVSQEPRVEGFCQMLTEEFAMPVHWTQPGQKAQWKRREDEEAGKALRASVMGVAWAQEKGFDLIPEDIKWGAHQRAKRSMALRVAVAGVLTLFALVMAFSVERIKGGFYAESLERRASALKVKVNKIEEKTGRIRMLAALINERVFLSDVIAAIYQSIPPGMSLASLSLSQGYSMVLQGVALRNEDINIFQKALLSSGWFNKVGLEFVNKRIEARGEVNFFKIVLGIKDRH